MEHISLELAKRLHDAGWRGNTDHIYTWNTPCLEDIYTLCFKSDFYALDATLDIHDYHAPTFTEIWRELPIFIYEERNGTCELTMFKDDSDSKTVIEYEASSYPFVSHDSPAEAAGQLLLWCIEQGHVKGKKG